MRWIYLTFWISLLIETKLVSQWKQEILFPGDSGFFLITKLANQYKPLNVLDYSSARFRMYKEIYNESDTVYCVYTRHGLFLSPFSTDPIGDLIKNGNANGINCEHTFPQSKGADIGNARSDMHHLYPARAAVNESRSNHPFSEIDDKRTETWFYKSTAMNSVPLNNIDEYSESSSQLFEPREEHKGNVARAIFYFITMYDLQSDRSFFEQMRPTLCNWHYKDPVDSLEWIRTFKIANYQDQKANPFILDCTLARRCYCPTGPECVVTKTIDVQAFTHLHVYSEKNETSLMIDLGQISTSDVYFQIADIYGKVYLKSTLNKNNDRYAIDIRELKSGLYLAVFNSKDSKPMSIKWIKSY